MPVTLPRRETRLPVEVRGGLCLDTPSGRTVQLRAEGRSLLLDVPGWPELNSMAPRSFRGRRNALAAAAKQLATLGVAVDINLRGSRLVSFGAGVKPTLLSRMFSLGSVNLPFTALSGAWRR